MSVIALLARLSLILLGNVLPASPAIAATASPAIFYVSPGGSDTRGTGDARAPFATVGHALAIAPAGSTIILKPGTYLTMVTIDKRVNVESDPHVPNAAATTIIDATGHPNGLRIQGPAASATLIRGLTVENADDQGILVEDAAQVIVEGNVVTNNARHPGPAPRDYQVMSEDKAIQLVGTTDSIVRDNTVVANQHGGIAVLDSRASAARGNTISGNDVARNLGDCGIVVAAYLPGKGVSHNTVAGNTVTGNVAGIVVAADPPGTSTTDNTVSGNVIVGNRLPGVIIHSNAPDQRVSGNVVSENTIRGNGSFAGIHLNQTAGIAIVGAVVPVTNTTLRSNKISDENVPVWQLDPPARAGSKPSRSLVVAGVVGLLLLMSSVVLAVRDAPAPPTR